jgi:CHAT domain-containing protein
LSLFGIIQVFSHGAGAKGVFLSDGLLKAEQVQHLELNAELVALTTCEGWEGDLRQNEGIMGMVNAFSRAGAKRQIASLWKIDEQSSALIMALFYEEIQMGKAADEALRIAKLRYLETAHPSERDPRFWAGLVLFGEPDGFRMDERTDNRRWLIFPIVLLLSGVMALRFRRRNRRKFF